MMGTAANLCVDTQSNEPEITQPVDLCAPNGSLNPKARGWARRPLHRCNLHGRVLRKKRWNTLAVAADEHAFIVTIADLDYLGAAALTLVDARQGTVTQQVFPVPFARGLHLGNAVRDDAHFEQRGLSVSFERWARGIRLRAESAAFGGQRMRASLWVEEPTGVETFNTVLPWNARQFHLSSEKTCLPASGAVELGATSIRFDHHNHAFASSQFGRGVWPYSTGIQRLTACGVQNRRAVGLSLFSVTGGRAAGIAAHSVSVDGRLYPLAQELRTFYDAAKPNEPWRILSADGQSVDLTFTPFRDVRHRANWVVGGADSLLGFGSLRGTIITGSPKIEPVRIERLTCWVQHHNVRW